MRTDDFDYPLPDELIAQAPAEPRDSCRLLVLNREDGSLEHRHFTDVIDYLDPGDLLVANKTRVMRASWATSVEPAAWPRRSCSSAERISTPWAMCGSAS